MNRINSLALWTMLIAVLFGCKTDNKDSTIAETTETSNAQKALKAVIDSVDSEIKDGDYGLIDRFMVIRNGELLADLRYRQDYDSVARQYDSTDHQYNYNHPNWHPYYQKTDLHTMQSVTKSVTSILLGIAFESHPEYTVETRVMPLFSDYARNNADERKREMTIEDLLTMRSGLQWNEGAYLDPSDDCIAMEASTDWIDYVLSKPTDTLPGTSFEYNSGNSVLLGKIVHMMTGKRIDDWAEETLFGPLGITDYYWKETPTGDMDTEGGLYLRAEDLVKIGKLFLNKGNWNGRQIVSEDWVSASTNPVVADVNPSNNRKIGYGYQWWVPKHTDGQTEIFAGNGFGGQYLFVVPDHDLIVLFNGWNINENPEKSSWSVLQERILPKLINNELSISK